MKIQARQCSPEQHLIVAVIERSVLDIVEGNSYAKNARRWLDSDFEEPFSFGWCCEQLGIDPQWILKKFMP